MSASFKDFGNKLATSLAPPSTGVPSTPRRRHDSIVAAQQLKRAWLTTRELVALIEFLPKVPTAFDVYSALTEPDVRKGGFAFNSKILVLMPLSILSRSYSYVSVVIHLIISFIAHSCCHLVDLHYIPLLLVTSYISFSTPYFLASVDSPST